jgi:hypothetical protein
VAVVTPLRGKRARAQPARFLTLGGRFLPCGAAMLRVAAPYQFACG